MFKLWKKKGNSNDNKRNGFSFKRANQDMKRIIKLPDYGDIFSYKPKIEELNNNKIGYFKNGMLYDVYPRNKCVSLDDDRGVAYDARYYISDRKKYDMYNPKDIIEMIIPKYDKTAGFQYVTRDLANMVMMKAKQAYQRDLAIPLVFTAVNLMIASEINYNIDDYKRMISQLERINENQYALELRKQINSYDSSLLDMKSLDKKIANNRLDLAADIGTDLVEIPYLGCTCEKCAIYQGRVYSISGKDRRFPKLPDFIKICGKIHEGCHHSIWPFLDVVDYIEKYIDCPDGSIKRVELDLIKNSNRPFVDDRSKLEKEKYIEYINKNKYAKYEQDPETLRKYAQRRIEYEWIVENLNDIAPKSLSGYTNMKRKNSSNYINIKDKAAEMGMILEDDL